MSSQGGFLRCAVRRFLKCAVRDVSDGVTHNLIYKYGIGGYRKAKLRAGEDDDGHSMRLKVRDYLHYMQHNTVSC